MGKGSAPPPPDYAAAATAQGQANKETAQYNAGANRVNQIGPDGSTTWSVRPGADPNNPQPGDYIQTTSLSAGNQAQYDAGQNITNQLLGTAGQQLGRVSETFNSPVNMGGLPAWQTSGGAMGGGGAGGGGGKAQAMPNPSMPGGGGQPMQTKPMQANTAPTYQPSDPWKAPAGQGFAASTFQNAPASAQGNNSNYVYRYADGTMGNHPVQPGAARGAPEGQLLGTNNGNGTYSSGYGATGPEALSLIGGAGGNMVSAAEAAKAWGVDPASIQMASAPAAGASTPGGLTWGAGGPAQGGQLAEGFQTYNPATAGTGGVAPNGNNAGIQAILKAFGIDGGGGGAGGTGGVAPGRFGAGSVPSAVNDTSRQRVEQAVLSRLEPQFRKDSEAMQAQLAARGLEVGSQAYASEMDRLQRAQDDQRMQAVLAGGQEESRQVGLNANLQQQGFQQGLQGSQFDNQTRQQMLSEMLAMRNLPLNELNALRTGSQVNQPQFGSYYTNNAQAAPLFDAASAQGNYDMAAYQNKQSGTNAFLGGLASLGGAGIMKFSDRRLKSNIEQLGTTRGGHKWYRWDWVDGSGSGEGVMADEVPASATSIHASGFAMVDYSKID